MKNVDDMTNEEALKELSNTLLDYVPSEIDKLSCPCSVEDKLLNLSNKFGDDGSLVIDMQNFTAVIYFEDEDGEEYEIIANLISADFFDALYEYLFD